MLIIPIKTPLLTEGDDLASVLFENAEIMSGDIVVVSSKAMATVEGAAIDLSTIDVSAEAEQWAAMHDRPAAFRQAVLNEMKRLNGTLLQGEGRYMLTELQPDGMSEGTIVVTNAGLDQSNIKEGYVIGWPQDGAASTESLRSMLCSLLRNTEGNEADLGVIMSDSTLRPRRLGVTAVALTVSGFDPIVSQVERSDLFGEPLKITHEAIADQLAIAANSVMGNADQSIPAAIVRDSGITLRTISGWVPGIDPDEDLFKGLL